MLKKIILPLVLLIFAQQNFYGMKTIKKNKNSQVSIWKTINMWVNKDITKKVGNKYPKLWWLWAILDNVPFQYGGSKTWKHGEAYYGLSNGIGFFPSFLNFGWLKVGMVDAHINVINTIIKYMKTYTVITYDYYYQVIEKDEEKKHKNPVWLNSLKWWLFYTVVTDIHLFSFKFFNCVKIKIISIGAIITSMINCSLHSPVNDYWYFPFIFYDEQLEVFKNYFIFSPRIEINIPGIIDYFKEK